MADSLLTILIDCLYSGVFPWEPRQGVTDEEIYQRLDNGLRGQEKLIEETENDLPDICRATMLTVIQDIREALTIMKSENVTFCIKKPQDDCRLITSTIPPKAQKILESALSIAKVAFNQKVDFTPLSRLTTLEVQSFCSVFLNQDEPNQCISLLSFHLKILTENFEFNSSDETERKSFETVAIKVYQNIRFLVSVLAQMWSEDCAIIFKNLFEISTTQKPMSLFGLDELYFRGVLQNRIVLLVNGLILNGTAQSVIVSRSTPKETLYIDLKHLAGNSSIESGQCFGDAVRSKNIGSPLKTERGVIVYTNGVCLSVNWLNSNQKKKYQLPDEWKDRTTATMREINDEFVKVDTPRTKNVNVVRARDGNTENTLLLDLEVETLNGVTYWCVKFNDDENRIHILRAVDVKMPRCHLTMWSPKSDCFETVYVTDENPNELVWSNTIVKINDGDFVTQDKNDDNRNVKETMTIVPDYFGPFEQLQVNDIIVYDKIIVLAISLLTN